MPKLPYDNNRIESVRYVTDDTSLTQSWNFVPPRKQLETREDDNVIPVIHRSANSDQILRIYIYSFKILQNVIDHSRNRGSARETRRCKRYGNKTSK